jgi:hypothetical protein
LSSCCTPDELKDECILRCERERENFAKSAENFGFQFSRHVLQICDRVSSDPCNAAALEHFICMLMNFGASATTEAVFNDFVCRFSTASCERLGRGYGMRGIAGWLGVTAERPSGSAVSLNRSSGVHDGG